MEQIARVGASVVIKGTVTAGEPLSISGRVEGTIDAAGHRVTIEPGAQVHADISAGTIIVSGLVEGSLTAAQSISLQHGAEVRGDISAPRVGIQDGAFVQGTVDSTGRAIDLARAS